MVQPFMTPQTSSIYAEALPEMAQHRSSTIDRSTLSRYTYVPKQYETPISDRQVSLTSEGAYHNTRLLRAPNREATRLEQTALDDCSYSLVGSDDIPDQRSHFVSYREEAGNRETPSEHTKTSFQPRNQERSNASSLGPPVVQGITLVPTRTLPDRYRGVFAFPVFNAVQSKSFATVYNSDDNLVVSAPTGSGKTAIMELAICRLANQFPSGSFKIVYQAPTKSLCSERQRDWQAKFSSLDLSVAELTGDTDFARLKDVQNAAIIVTTPEKWDSITRKWRDHRKLMQMVKLFLIDEVHILKEDRGATLEAVVSRMKSVGSDVRFVALSATVPNLQDIAAWLGRNASKPSLPAACERFSEEFRPVRLQKHVCGYQSNSNDFAFEKTLNNRLPDLIEKWSQRKPIMVFCFTRTSCVETARLLANWWATKSRQERCWNGPPSNVEVEDKDLRGTMTSLRLESSDG